jgi:LPS sulfotransferase NodH
MYEAHWNQRNVVDPERTYLVASVKESGSSVLTAALRATGRLGVPFEYFARESIAFFGGQRGALPLSARRRLRLLRLRLKGEAPWIPLGEFSGPSMTADYVRALQRIRTTPNGVFGAKVHHNHLTDLRSEAGVDLLDVVQPRRVILFTRKDHERQAALWRRGPESAAVDEAAIKATIELIEIAEDGWRDVLGRYAAPVLEVTYEEFDADFDALAARCFAFLGEPDVPVPLRDTAG